MTRRGLASEAYLHRHAGDTPPRPESVFALLLPLERGWLDTPCGGSRGSRLLLDGTRYSPECVEDVFCEVRISAILNIGPYQGGAMERMCTMHARATERRHRWSEPTG
jgi:hypothetical protein